MRLASANDVERIAQLSSPSPVSKDQQKFPLFIMIIKTLRADWAIKVDVFLSHVEEWIPCVNLFWLSSGYLQGFPVDFLLLSESWSFYLPFSSPPLRLLRCCSLEIFAETAVMGGEGAYIVLNRRDLHCTVRIRALASLTIGRRPHKFNI